MKYFSKFKLTNKVSTNAFALVLLSGVQRIWRSSNERYFICYQRYVFCNFLENPLRSVWAHSQWYIYMAGMLQEEHPVSLMYKIFLKIISFYPLPWPHYGTKHIGNGFILSVMDLRFRKCWKIGEKALKRVSKIACIFGQK